ncbi:MAG: asparagine synthase (glutamine-hydrolyzing), partial [Candidatus Omnitrophota bacterium]|nr:asparagine synthase (glutamine-hydrolyzing) [Candidatus Omnitrophota bacterium]
MCGISGLLHFNDAPINPRVLRAMTDVIAHRGPDDSGEYICGPIGLGHRRLAIIDISPAGKQPMSNEDASIWITCNGEIYNFLDLRDRLIKKGHKFRSASDTETIIHAYEEWGTDCLKYLNGMFAFALWDAAKQRLWLVRDRLGIKPLFYHSAPNSLIFGSEIKAILAHPDINRKLNYEALAYYLALNYAPAPHTLFFGINQLLPGHYLIVSQEGQVQDTEYWDLVFKENECRDEKFYINEFTNLLEDSVRLRLASDVPFGVFLSGGLDSGSVSYWMAENSGKQIKTFSAGFKENSFNELPYARHLAQLLNTDHHECIVDMDVIGILPKIVWHAEEPTADSSMVAQYYLAKMVRGQVKMVLTGDGGDEILAGYETYPAYFLSQLARLLPKWFYRHIAIPLADILPVSYEKLSWDFKLRRFLSGIEFSPEDAHATRRMVFDKESRRQLLSANINNSGSKADAIDLYREMFSRSKSNKPLNRMLYVDTRFYLPNDILVKLDRMTMACGIEARAPLLDYRLVNFLATVPVHLKIKHFHQGKHLLKAAMKNKIPDRIIYRKKQGFNIPQASWIKDRLRPFVME